MRHQFRRPGPLPETVRHLGRERDGIRGSLVTHFEWSLSSDNYLLEKDLPKFFVLTVFENIRFMKGVRNELFRRWPDSAI